MSKNKIVILLIIVVLGIFIFQLQNSKNKPAFKNAEFLKGDKNIPISVESVSYFPGATGYFARPADKASYPGVVMIHENRGLREETKMVAERLAQEGYMVLAVDLLGATVETQEEAKVLTAEFSQDEGEKNMREAVKFLRNKGAKKIASLGWCFGGRQSLELATSGEKLDATVVYYGGGMATEKEALSPIKWPVLGIFGDEDKVIPVEMVKKFELSLNELGVENEIYIYPGVGHAFANPSGMNYAPNETKDAWVKTLAFLEFNLR